MWLRTRIFIHMNIKHYPDRQWHRVCMSANSLQCRPTLCDLTDCSPPGSSGHGISQARYWNGLPFPLPEDLLDPGIEPASLLSPAFAGRFFTTSTSWLLFPKQFKQLLQVRLSESRKRLHISKPSCKSNNLVNYMIKYKIIW